MTVSYVMSLLEEDSYINPPSNRELGIVSVSAVLSIPSHLYDRVPA